MSTRLPIICLSFLMALSGLAHAQEKLTEVKNNEILMYVGEVKTLATDKIQRIAVGNGKLFTTSVLNNKELLLIAEAPGDSSLVIWSDNSHMKAYTVRISSRDSHDAYRNISAMLQGIPKIKITQVGTNVVITGNASEDDLARIGTAVKAYPQATNLVSKEEMSMKKMIYMKVQIVEMNKTLIENIGLQWPGSATGPMLGFAGNFGTDKPQTQGALKGILPMPNNGLLTYLGVSSLINTTINLAKNNGDVYTLAEPELSARSGGEATFLAGGQVPIPVSSAFSSSVEFKDYGIRLMINPVADDDGNIKAKIQTEISSIDPSVSVSGIPGFLTRKSGSEVNVRTGQTIVMSGLVNTTMSNDSSRVPGIGDIPVLGRLFRSDGFRSGRTDLVILVTPTIVDPASTINRERIEKGMDMRERFERKLSNQDIID